MGRAFCKRLYKSRWKIRRISIELLACSLVNDGGLGSLNCQELGD
jgi:hypothetical protein